MPNPGSLFSCRGPKTYAVSWRTENQIVNSSYHKNSPDPVEGYWITHNLDCPDDLSMKNPNHRAHHVWIACCKELSAPVFLFKSFIWL
jgi:hypothetical protein